MTYPYTTRFQALPGNINMAYIDEGSGERTILFIHGLANYALVWRKNIDYLKQYYRCIAIDLPGNGFSDQNEHPYSMKFFAETVYNFIKTLGLKKLCIAGHSMGGQIAMTTLINYPTCADSLILCAPAGFETFSPLDRTLYYSTIRLFDFVSSEEQSIRTVIERSFFHNHLQAESVIRELIALMKTYKLGYYRNMVEACVHSMLEEPVIDKLHLIKQPTLILFGSKDALIPNKLIHHTTTEKMASEVVKKLPNATLEFLPDCGHFLQWEKAEEVNKLIIRFLGTHGS